MKRVLFTALLMLTFLPLFDQQGQSSCRAQNMATESLWHLADKTGFYGKERCDYCDVFISGESEEELEVNMMEHIMDKHLKESSEGDGNENNNDTDENPNKNNSSSVTHIDIVNIEEAAQSAYNIGIDSKQEFLNNYYCYGNGYLFSNYVTVGNLANFICNRYRAYSVADIRSTNGGSFFALRKCHINESYDYFIIYTNSNCSYMEDYDYVYVFH